MLASEQIVISVERLRLRCRHGVGEQERLVGNDFEVTVSLSYPPALEASRTDALDSTINYAHVVHIIKEVMSRPTALLERACRLLQQELLAAYPLIASGEVTLTKLLPPVEGAQLAGATVTLRWS